jgi:3-dehydroquinate dehydratase-1
MNLFAPPFRPLVVGSLASPRELAAVSPAAARAACDLIEIRLDGLAAAGVQPAAAPWAHLRGLPLLFTARRADEGGAGDLTAGQRAALLAQVLDDAAAVDIEVASLAELPELLESLRQRGVPWIASCHDFTGAADENLLEQACQRAVTAGAAVFKAALLVRGPEDLPRLAAWQARPRPIPAAIMGMGPLALVSRLLCAQYGSALHYGFLGETPTAPGQWPAAKLREALRELPLIR